MSMINHVIDYHLRSRYDLVQFRLVLLKSKELWPGSELSKILWSLHHTVFSLSMPANKPAINALSLIHLLPHSDQGCMLHWQCHYMLDEGLVISVFLFPS